MKHFRIILSLIALSVPMILGAQNQAPQTPEQREKQMLEYIDKEVKRLSDLLKLEYWQEFYVDSTLTHDLTAMQEEMDDLQKAKVGNADIFMAVRDKWMQQIADSYQRFFDENQWKKYLKSGGAREQRARDKRRQNTEAVKNQQ